MNAANRAWNNTTQSNMSLRDAFERAFGVKEITSDAMQKAIILWDDLYYNRIPDCDIDPSQRIPCILVDGIEQAAFGEYECTVDETTPKGKNIARLLESLEKIRPEAFQKTLIGGEGFIRPIPYREGFSFAYISRRNMFVFGRDIEGNVTDLGLVQFTQRQGDKGTVYYYTLMERRRVDENGYLTIWCKLYRGTDKAMYDTLAPLSEAPEFAYLQEYGGDEGKTLAAALDGLGFIPIATPMSNSVDGSKDRVSFYAKAVDQIWKSYGLERRTVNEYEATEPRVFASIDVLPPHMRPGYKREEWADSSYGRWPDLPKVITPAIDSDPDSAGLTIYNPVPNQTELEARDNQIRRGIEDLLHLRRGFLSQVQNEEFTATEILSTSTKYAHLLTSLQKKTWEPVVRETVRVCNILAQIYSLPGWDNTEPPVVTIGWGNGVLYDEDKEYSRYMQLVSSGYLMPEYLLKWMEVPILDDAEIEDLQKLMPDLPDADENDGDDGGGNFNE